MTCIDCEKPAVWVRHTQFAGDHPFCDQHAKSEKDFGKVDSCTDWERLMEDLDGQGTTFADLDPGIRKTVEWLLDRGYATCDSGDGVTKFNNGIEYDEHELLPVPHVFMMTSMDRIVEIANRLKEDLEALGVEVSPVGQGEVYIDATFDPVDESAIIGLYGLNDAMLEKSFADRN